MEQGTFISGTRRHRQVWDTRQVRERESFSYYREGLCQALFALTPQVEDRGDFSGRIEQLSLERGAINYLEHVPHNVRRSARDTNEIGERYLHMNYQISGTNNYIFDENLAARQPGTLIAFRSACPFGLQMEGSETNSLVSLLVPESDLKGVFSLDGPTQISPAYDLPIRTLFTTLVHQLDIGSHEEFEQIYGSIVSLLNASFASNAESSSSTEESTSLEVVKAFIKQNLCQPNLTPERISGAFGISRRYLDKLFSHSGETCAQYLRRSRISRAHIDILDPAQHQTTLTEIAFRWGFADLSTFNRSYAKQFGCSASATRKLS